MQNARIWRAWDPNWARVNDEITQSDLWTKNFIFYKIYLDNWEWILCFARFPLPLKVAHFDESSSSVIKSIQKKGDERSFSRNWIVCTRLSQRMNVNVSINSPIFSAPRFHAIFLSSLAECVLNWDTFNCWISFDLQQRDSIELLTRRVKILR